MARDKNDKRLTHVMDPDAPARRRGYYCHACDHHLEAGADLHKPDCERRKIDVTIVDFHSRLGPTATNRQELEMMAAEQNQHGEHVRLVESDEGIYLEKLA